MRSLKRMTDLTLYDLGLDELIDRLKDLGLPAYRGNQIWTAAFRNLATDYETITTLPRAIRDSLAAEIPFPRPVVVGSRASADGRTVKDLLQLSDQETVEVVTMAYADRITACVSSQIGCALACAFCATGQSGFVRNLTQGEIVGQAVHAARRAAEGGRRLSNVVFMGMGEPLLNLDAVLGAIALLNDPRGMGLAARAFTVSTAGVVPGIDRLAQEPLQLNLAVSLHTVDDGLRNRLVPLNRRHVVSEILAACWRYAARTRRRVSFEVALIAGVNDAPADARSLARALRGRLAHVNLIPLNAVPGKSLRRSSPAAIAEFEKVLLAQRISVSVRDSRGTEIAAGCGQLRARRATP